MSSSRSLLLKDLADLLGFEDGVDNVLDHLLTIESSKDLSDYLSELLGSADERIESLVDNIARFQKGETIAAAPSDDGGGNAAAKTNVERDYGPRKQTKSKTPPRQRQKQQQRPLSKTPPRQKQTFSNTVTGGVNLTPTKTTHSPTPAEMATAQAMPVPNNDVTTTTKPIQKFRPTRGKAEVVCGCFGNFHKPLTNCLFCGRISCEKEGYSYCPHCGYEIQVVTKGGGKDAASKHKERLLRFDREYAKRTVVLDDQADHFTNQSLNWMGEEEREQALAVEQERDEKSRNSKMQLSLAL